MVDLVPDKCVYELEMNGRTKKTPRPHRTKLNQSHVSETQMKIPSRNLTNCHSKLQITSVFWWFICACWPPPLRWPHEASTAVHETAHHCSCPKQGPNLDTVMIHDNLNKQTSKAFLKCSFHTVRLHACVRQLDSLEVALVIVSWWEPNCGGASKTCSAKKSLTFSIPHGVPQPARTSLAGLRRGCFSSHDLGKIVQVILRPSSSST